MKIKHEHYNKFYKNIVWRFGDRIHEDIKKNENGNL